MVVQLDGWLASRLVACLAVNSGEPKGFGLAVMTATFAVDCLADLKAAHSDDLMADSLGKQQAVLRAGMTACLLVGHSVELSVEMWADLKVVWSVEWMDNPQVEKMVALMAARTDSEKAVHWVDALEMLMAVQKAELTVALTAEHWVDPLDSNLVVRSGVTLAGQMAVSKAVTMVVLRVM